MPETVSPVRPNLAVVSARRDKRFGRSHPEVVRRYANTGTPLLITGDVGAVTLCADGRQLAVATEHGAALRLEP